MATILLSAAGAAAGASIGGSAFGLSAVVLGRAAGATVGRLIDSKILGAGSPAIERGKVDRFRLTGASEGAPVARVHGRIRVAGQVIWASQFQEIVTTAGGGKGSLSQPKTRSYSYTISLAIALCEGEISRVGRIWADGLEISKSEVNIRVYSGSATQMPDPKIEATEGIGAAPAYRGTAYVIFEDLDLGRFGNRVPQFSFEVVRTTDGDPASYVNAVALIPGTGEYGLATTPVHFEEGPGKNRSANINTPSGDTDFQTSLDALVEELPTCASSSLVVSWFGSDLRCGSCSIKPKVEQTALDGIGMAWQVSGLSRAVADIVPQSDGRPVYGGTPSDGSVIEAIQALSAAGQSVMFYPFVLMDQTAGNGLVDPWTGAVDQPILPWRGRITTSLAPGQAGSPDGTSSATSEVQAFFGTATAGDFVVDGTSVIYTGADAFTYRRFILHYAALCSAAGGVDAFCIGSEMRSLTQIRGDSGSFPVVQELIDLAAEARTILGPDTKIGYAADWSEYFGYHPQDGSGDVYFHLDPLWADDEIDFIGIDNYMPLSDWRDGADHADASWGSIYELSYLKANIAGGEGYDWYYKSDAAEELQVRTPITDGAYGEPWVFRYKDLRNWWSRPHHERIGGIRQSDATAWLPGSKPFWFTEIGCAAIDKGSNQPNKFLDSKSSESGLPKYSTGARDDLVQMQYLRAISEFWADPANNPEATLYSGRMVDADRQFAWAWDARPFPHFPGNQTLWSDGENYARGHWLSGRVSARSLATVISEICVRSGVADVDVSNVFGFVRGYRQNGDESAREALQPLLLAASVDVVEKNGLLVFRNRSALANLVLRDNDLAELEDGAITSQSREPLVEIPDRVRLNFLEADGDYEIRAEESVYPEGSADGVSQSELPLVLTQSEGLAATERWLSEVRVGRDTATFAVPPSVELTAGSIVEMDTDGLAGLFRIDRIEEYGVRKAEAVRIEPGLYQRAPTVEPIVPTRPVTVPLPVWPVIMDLPLLRGDEDAEAPWVAATAVPWPGQVAVYGSSSGTSWGYEAELSRPATMGETVTELKAAEAGVWDRATQLEVSLTSGALSSISEQALFSGGNVALIGHPSIPDWEVFQFRDATLIDQDVWALSMRLRGQRGTDGIIPVSWPIGSTVVFVDEALRQIPIAPSQRGVEREYRIGPASKPVDHPAFQTLSHVANGVGLRPYRPVHLRARQLVSADIRISWVRQTRIDGDFWDAMDVPLGEAVESYQLRVIVSGTIRREEIVSASEWIYTVADQSADGISGAFSIDVAQISDRFGLGLAGKVTIDV